MKNPNKSSKHSFGLRYLSLVSWFSASIWKTKVTKDVHRLRLIISSPRELPLKRSLVNVNRGCSLRLKKTPTFGWIETKWQQRKGYNRCSGTNSLWRNHHVTVHVIPAFGQIFINGRMTLTTWWFPENICTSTKDKRIITPENGPSVIRSQISLWSNLLPSSSNSCFHSST